MTGKSKKKTKLNQTSSEEGTLLNVSQVSQSFRSGFFLKSIPALQEVSFEIPKKSIFGLLGPNSAGKTTLIHLLAGIKTPKKGNIFFNGRDVLNSESREQIGYLPERPYFYEYLTAEQFLIFMGKLSGKKTSEMKTRIPELLKTVGLTDARKKELRKFSKGMLQRIGIAQAILHDPEFLILDEPMSGLDPVGRKEMRELILRLNQEGKTILFSSHIISDVEAICHQVAVLHRGKLMGAGPIGQFLSQGPIQTEVAFSGVEAKNVARWNAPFDRVQTIPDGFKILANGQEEVGHILKEVMKKQGQILWVQPQRPSLEDWFSEEGRR